MKTVQMTLDDDLVKAVDKAARELGTSRSSFTRKALRSALEKLRMTALERKHRAGYERKPVRRGEFDGWDNEQAWGDA
jgi:metal-responsive CopG/Arc/MetJ family transcriptional regulator